MALAAQRLSPYRAVKDYLFHMLTSVDGLKAIILDGDNGADPIVQGTIQRVSAVESTKGLGRLGAFITEMLWAERVERVGHLKAVRRSALASRGATRPHAVLVPLCRWSGCGPSSATSRCSRRSCATRSTASTTSSSPTTPVIGGKTGEIQGASRPTTTSSGSRSPTSSSSCERSASAIPTLSP